MAWEIKDIDLSEIELSKRTGRYSEIYEKIFSLKVGKAFEIKTDTAREAANIRNTVSSVLKKKGLSDKYIASNRGNLFVCGRTK